LGIDKPELNRTKYHFHMLHPIPPKGVELTEQQSEISQRSNQQTPASTDLGRMNSVFPECHGPPHTILTKLYRRELTSTPFVTRLTTSSS